MVFLEVVGLANSGVEESSQSSQSCPSSSSSSAITSKAYTQSPMSMPKAVKKKNQAKKDSHQCSVANPGCLSRIQGKKDSRIPELKNLSILTQVFLSARKYDSGCPSRIRIPDLDLVFFYPFRIPGPGVKKAPDTASGSATLHQCHNFQAHYKYNTLTRDCQ